MNDVVIATIQNLLELHQLEEQLDRARTGKAEIQAKINLIREKLIPNILGHHDRMRARGRKSIAPVRNGVCAGCHMVVATGILATLRRQDDIQLCANCGRYLYIDETPPEPPAEAAVPAGEAPPKKARKKRVSKRIPVE
ncbi:C4-type zinc ribbon domain-containing protein [Fontisphaera persica]|uniref:C4-type zinc ribbon domain-containing protein n=1 Tax=Fontisphaera persica TaxID=2974023 RepID=UPI0024BF6E58|nr:C4-type zinc ribbon domain-containing protein [Fontisphaera persica]WCJ58352.1 C4-type zinc ribbon domain-containing protein [Fontisphaera persica]